MRLCNDAFVAVADGRLCRRWVPTVLLVCLLAAAGCAVTEPKNTDPARVPAAETAASLLAFQATYQRLGPERRNRFLAAVEEEYGRAPTPDNALRLALLLARPDAREDDVARACRLLAGVVDKPWALRPDALDLAQREYRHLKKRLDWRRRAEAADAAQRGAEEKIEALKAKINALTDIEQSVDTPTTDDEASKTPDDGEAESHESSTDEGPNPSGR